MYKYDPHTHTAEVSPCGRVEAKELVRLYKEEGYDGIVITDHYYLRYFEGLGEINWHDKISSYLLGYYRAKEAGYKYNLTVLLGIELTPVEVSPNHLLIYGIDEEFLLNNPELYYYSLDELKQIKTEHDILIYQAHPYRIRCNAISHDLLDGVEVYNGSPRKESYNHLALEFAKDNELLMISSSDTHMFEEIGKGGILSKEKIDSIYKLVDYLKKIKEQDLVTSNANIHSLNIQMERGI